jgi:undecaprenyl-diphosphatase
MAVTGWVAALAGAAVLTWLLKIVVRRPRPPDASRFPQAASFSFPSGHALISLVGFGMLVYLLVTHWAPARRHPWLTAGSLGALVLAIGLSRLYLVVHYLSDVVAGYAAGLVWLASCVTGTDIALGRRGLDPWAVPGASPRST